MTPISEVVIDQHYQQKYSDINDNIILNLVASLDGLWFEPVEIKNGFSYFAIEPVLFQNAPYRLVVLTPLDNDYFLGVINAFRVNRRSKQ